jgi:hypothetical protein
MGTAATVGVEDVTDTLDAVPGTLTGNTGYEGTVGSSSTVAGGIASAFLEKWHMLHVMSDVCTCGGHERRLTHWHTFRWSRPGW